MSKVHSVILSGVFAALCRLLFAAEPAAGLLSFHRVEIDTQPPKSPYVKLAGDFDGDGKLNGDGRPDILGANHSGPFQPVELWLNRPATAEDRSPTP